MRHFATMSLIVTLVLGGCTEDTPPQTSTPEPVPLFDTFEVETAEIGRQSLHNRGVIPRSHCFLEQGGAVLTTGAMKSGVIKNTNAAVRFYEVTYVAPVVSKRSDDCQGGAVVWMDGRKLELMRKMQMSARAQ